MSPTLPRSRAGRPKDPAKHNAILAAALQLFTQHPFDMVTMEAVATRASVSKMTVYSHFADKEMLYEAIVISIADQMIASILVSERDDEPLFERLVATGIGFLSVILSPSVSSLSQMLPTALRGNQALAVRFYNAGPGRVKPVLASVIAQAAKLGAIKIDDAALAAQDLVSLWEGGLAAERSCGLIGPTSPDEIARRVRRGTEVFLRAYAP